MAKIIDIHSHYMPPVVAAQTAFFKVQWSDIDRQLAVMDQCGIEQAVLSYPTSDAHLKMGGWTALARVYNDEISAVVRRHPDRLIGAGILPVDDPAALREELGRLGDLGLRAVSLASSYQGRYLDDEAFIPVLEFARRSGMPVLIHPQICNPIGEERVRDPLLSPVLEYVFDVAMCIGKLLMSGTLRRFPTVKMIFAHYGGVLPFVRERFDNTYQMLRSRDLVPDLGQLPGEAFRQLYFDVSGSKSVAALLCGLELADAGHILFGSDFPANRDIPGTIAAIRGAELSGADKAAILFDNAWGLFGED